MRGRGGGEGEGERGRPAPIIANTGGKIIQRGHPVIRKPRRVACFTSPIGYFGREGRGAKSQQEQAIRRRRRPLITPYYNNGAIIF